MSFILDNFLDLVSSFDVNGPFGVFWFLFKSGGWVIVVFFMIWGFWQLWMDYIQGKYASTLNFIYLAIDVPRENEQSLKAVEQIFAQIAGAHATLSMADKYWYGKNQDAFSFEIVSIDGHVQFVVRCLDKHRDLIESTIYAQYPNTEITEIEDYTKNVPDEKDWPHEDWDLWGTEVILAKDEYFPIRTYPHFEHSPLTKESIFADPLNAILEIMGKINPGEQVWFQFVIQHPPKPGWGEDVDKVVAKLMGKKVEEKPSKFTQISEFPVKTLSYLSEEAIGAGFWPEDGNGKDDKIDWGALSLSPGEIDVLKGVQMKASKLGFHTKIRIIYIAKKDVMQKSRVPAIFGAVKQYNTQNMNAFKPDTKYTMTSALYFNVKRRIIQKQKNILGGYKARSTWRGTGTGKILNIEELASVWHFPLSTVTGPLVKRAEAKKAGPPGNLIFEDQVMAQEATKKIEVEKEPETTEVKADDTKKAAPPEPKKSDGPAPPIPPSYDPSTSNTSSNKPIVEKQNKKSSSSAPTNLPI